MYVVVFVFGKSWHLHLRLPLEDSAEHTFKILQRTRSITGKTMHIKIRILRVGPDMTLARRAAAHVPRSNKKIGNLNFNGSNEQSNKF
jgi:hypothetical protein